MKKHMLRVGDAIRTKYRAIDVPDDEVIDLVMDNAGGHGRQDVIDEYVEQLMTKFKVRVVWQEPRSPETNLFDLGVWMSLQSAVEKKHCTNRSDVNALARTVKEVWDTFDSKVFENVYGRWKKVLSLILADNGDNTLVDSHRGELLVPAVVAASPDTDDAASDVDKDEGKDDDDEDNAAEADSDDEESGWPLADDVPVAIEVEGEEAPDEDE